MALYGLDSGLLDDNGNISADPLFIDPATGNYEPGIGSPAIDSGYGSSASPMDMRGLPRHDDAGMPNLGYGQPWYADMGAFERQDDTEAADIAISYISRPTPQVLDPNDIFNINWTVVNNGTLEYSGNWQEKVWLSTNEYISPDDLLLETYDVDGPLAVGESYNQSLTMNVPLDVSGLYYLLVTLEPTGDEWDIYTANNTACSDGLMAVGLDWVDTENPIAATIQTGQWHYYRYQAEAGNTVRFILDSDCVTGGMYIYILYEGIPTATNYDASGAILAQPDQVAGLVSPISGNYYIAIFADSPDGGQTGYTLSAQLTDLEITTVDPTLIGNSDLTTVAIDGNNFDPNSRIELLSGENVLAEAAMYYETSQRVYATFDLAASAVGGGSYSLRVSDAQQAEFSTLADCLTVQDGGQSDFFANIQLPGMARPGRVVSIQLTYGNRGAIDMYSSQLTLTGPQDDCEWQLPQSDNWQASKKILMMALSTTGPANILRPGQSETVTIKFRTPLTYTARHITVSVNSLGTRPGDGSELPINWSNWYNDQTVITELENVFGTTWGEYVNSLGQIASIYKGYGGLVYSVDQLAFDVLLAFSPQNEMVRYNQNKTDDFESSIARDFRLPLETTVYEWNGVDWVPAVGIKTGSTAIIIHGWNATLDTHAWEWPFPRPFKTMATALEDKVDHVLGVYWDSFGITLYDPITPAMRIPAVARDAYHQLVELLIQLRNTQIIGHSHGAHVAGLIGNKFRGDIKKITALDASEETSHAFVTENLYGTGWGRSSAQFVEFYKSSKWFGGESAWGNDNFIVVSPGRQWGTNSGDWNPFANHGYAITWYIMTINNSNFVSVGYNWNASSWDTAFEELTGYPPDRVPNYPWKGIIRGDLSEVIECFTIGRDIISDNNKWSYPGTWPGGYGDSLSIKKMLCDLAAAVEMRVTNLSTDVQDNIWQTGGQGTVYYTVENHADNLSIKHNLRLPAQLGKPIPGTYLFGTGPIEDCLWLSKDVKLDPDDYLLIGNTVYHDDDSDFLGNLSDGDYSNDYNTEITMPGEDAILSWWDDTELESQYYLIVDAGAMNNYLTTPYSRELYPSNNFGVLDIYFEDEDLSAEAGSDRTLYDDDGDGWEMITLDGSGSAPDDVIDVYEWSVGLSGKQVEYAFPVNTTTTVTLTVRDTDTGESDTDEVTIVVRSSSDPPDGDDEDDDTTESNRPRDPEDKFGPAGYDDPNTPEDQKQRFIGTNAPIQYRIEYWNHEDAVVPAQVVTMRDTLDPAIFDLSTLEFTRIGFLKWDIDLPAGTKAIDQRIDLRPDMDLVVDVTTTINYETGLVIWRFQCSDPLTGDWPTDPMAGFLPPFNMATGYELGWIEFRVQTLDGFPTGTVIANQAYGEFDDAGDWADNPAPPDGPWINTIDNGDPSSHVLPLQEISTRQFQVNWTGEDDEGGSGIFSYDIHVSENGQPYLLWLATSDTSAIFDGDINSTYSFYSVARDNVGNTEEPPAEPDATTTVELLSPNLNGDNIVNLSDLNICVEQWLSGDCTIDNDWCDFCDFNQDGTVNFEDLCLISEQWMKTE